MTDNTAPTGALGGLRVMVIDDSKTIRRTAETLLKREGCEVVTASEAEMTAHVWLEWDDKTRAEVTALWKRWRPR